MLMVLPYETVTFLPFYVARQMGMLRDEGLRIDYLYSQSGGPEGGKFQKVDLALRGDIAFFCSVSTSIEAVLRGWGDVVAVAASAERPFFLLVRDEVQTVGDLQGRRILTGGGASRNEMLYLAAGMGWEVGKDVELVRGDGVDRQRALATGEYDAVAGRTHLLGWAGERGYRALPYAPGTTWYEGGVAVTRQFLDHHREEVAGFVRALHRATRFIADEANREPCVEVLTQYVKLLGRADAETGYDAHREHFSPALTLEGLRYMAEVLAVAKGVPAATWGPQHVDLDVVAP
jgi:ABC-type nitrate/sulfonate/bicarbonate transport system substrate-binding protein